MQYNVSFMLSSIVRKDAYLTRLTPQVTLKPDAPKEELEKWVAQAITADQMVHWQFCSLQGQGGS